MVQHEYHGRDTHHSRVEVRRLPLEEPLLQCPFLVLHLLHLLHPHQSLLGFQEGVKGCQTIHDSSPSLDDHRDCQNQHQHRHHHRRGSQKERHHNKLFL